MKTKDNYSKVSAGAELSVSVVALALTLILVAGCGGRHERGVSEEMVAPKPPEFLIGPASALLTNATAFSARVTIDSPGSSNQVRALTGQLLGEGSHLMFAPARGDRTYIWDVRERSGYVLSEALQGYAPLSSPLQLTGTTTLAEVAGPASDRVNGHPGHEAEVSVTMEDGSTARFSLWRASDLDGFPVRIKTLGSATPFVLNLADVQRATLSSNLFIPPDAFTRYASPESMATELMVRRAKPKKTDSEYFNEPKAVLKNSPP